MADANDTLVAARNLLREARVQQADDLITEYFAAEASAGREVKAAEPEPAAPRDPTAVEIDILTELIAIAGNKDSLLKLLAELHAVTE